ncbi:MAG TPA: hypothetical protein DCY79_01390 [Planctomycetaceae bacterium]|nr:hypothetical protein [Blastopirellula sp.]HAY78440.1 hypothetical protein [Planctomycetaceae bacterium]
MITRATFCWQVLCFCIVTHAALHVVAQPPSRGSLVEDRAAKKLIEAGDNRYEAEETAKAIEIWQSVIERYPRSRFRFLAHMKLGDYFLNRDRSYDRARSHFEIVAQEDNRDQAQRAEATMNMGICFYHARNYGKCFSVMRNVIESFPVSPQVNQAYYYIGLGHFQLGHYSRAIAALEKVGTTLADEGNAQAKLEAGKRFFIKIDDADLAVLDANEVVRVEAKTTSGDTETVNCFPVGRNVRLVLGSLPTRLGKPQPNNGWLEVKGGDKVQTRYTDEHTADKKLNVPVISEVEVVGDAVVAITDGAFSETLQGVVLGKSVNLRVNDPDHDVSDGQDTLKAVVELYRKKTDEEIEAEVAALAAQQAETESPATDEEALTDDEAPQIDKYKRVDRVEVVLTETAELPDDFGNRADRVQAIVGGDPEEEAAPEAADDPSVHTGVFYASLPLTKSETIQDNDGELQAMPGDQVRLVYMDERHSGDGVNQLLARARCLEGNIGGVRVTQATISDEELRVQTKLKTADALTQIGNRYKEFGLKKKADAKYQQALTVCEDIMSEARGLGGRMLEETYVQFWHIYFEMDRLELAAAMCQRLEREFPTSGFVDDALLQLADVARKQENYRRAIGIYTRLVNMQESQLRGEAQFGVAQCYDEMANAASAQGAAQMRDRAFQEYKKVFDQFPESGRVGEAVAEMADYYYEQQDYSRAIDTFETVLESHPDAKFLDVILFNYGRCLYRMDRKPEARRRFDQLIGDFPESPLAPDAKQISDALVKGGF